MKNITHLIIVDSTKQPLTSDGTRLVVTALDYITGNIPEDLLHRKNLRVVNLCSDYGYLHTGYYCSLLAEARGHRCIPAVFDIVHTKWKRVYKHSLPELELILNKATLCPDIQLESQEVVFFFGRSSIKELQKFGRKLFDAFRLPMIKVSFIKKKNLWKINEVEPLKLAALNGHTVEFNEALSKYTGSFWSKKKEDTDKYWLAILHDPEEKLPPSDKKALEKFIRIGKRKHFFVELITKHNLDSLLEYDALFIRETTNVNHHTYRFAQKAEKEGMPCIDDTLSILRCCNKIYLHELLKSKKVPTPETYFIYRKNKEHGNFIPNQFPVVLKVPDGSFSTGVFKINSAEEFHEKTEELFEESELLLVQEFFPSDYDWRIVILGGKPLFACKYYMAKQHWQIYNHSAKTNKDGDAECIPLDKVPQNVMKMALKSAALIGNGLYGVDLKEVEDAPYVIEINDNPSIESGEEDKLEGDKIYEAIFDHFEQLINA